MTRQPTQGSSPMKRSMGGGDKSTGPAGGVELQPASNDKQPTIKRAAIDRNDVLVVSLHATIPALSLDMNLFPCRINQAFPALHSSHDKIQAAIKALTTSIQGDPLSLHKKIEALTKRLKSDHNIYSSAYANMETYCSRRFQHETHTTYRLNISETQIHTFL